MPGNLSGKNRRLTTGDGENSRTLRTINDIALLLQSRRREGRLRGVVFSPDRDTLNALERAATLTPMELVTYTDAAGRENAESSLEGAHFNVFETSNPADELAQHLLGNREPCQFLVRGGLLPLDSTYEAISVAGAKREELFLSHVALLEIPSRGRVPADADASSDDDLTPRVDAPLRGQVLLVSDGFVHPRPDVETRLNIIRNSIKVSDTLGRSSPRVALLAAVEQVYPGIPVTVESAEIARMSAQGRIKGAFVDGPLSFDVALLEEAARDKGKGGDVAGRADLLIGSSVEVASGIYTALTILARVNGASVVVGGEAPLALPFPSDSVDNIFNSICLASLLGST